MKKNGLLNKTLKIAVVLTVFVAIALISTGCGRSISYLNDEQNYTLNSARVVEGTDDRVYEIDYTADYKVNEFIDTITKDQVYSTTDCRLIMKKLLAEKSSIIPSGRLSNSAPGCSSVVCKNPEGVPVIGRNYDLDINSNGATIVIHTAPQDGYKSVGVADGAQHGLSYKDLKDNTDNRELLLYAPYFTMDGVNEKGFACSIMLLNEGSTVQYSEKKWLPSTLVVRYLLDHADSVNNAIELLNEKDFRNDYLIDPIMSLASDISFHWALTDASGDKAIIEYVNGQMIVNKYPLKVQYNENDDTMQVEYPGKETGYLISTNFYVSEGFNNTKGDTGKWRYETLEKKMSENPTPTKNQLRDIMKSAKYYMNDKDFIAEMKKMGLDPSISKNWSWITVWTDILNTSEHSLTLWSRENYEKENTFNLKYKAD